MLKVIIVDDDPTFGLMIKNFLTKNGFEADEVLNARNCVKAMQEKTYDIALLDFRLPDMDGIELLKQIKHKNPALPVILMTSYANIRTAVKAMQLGAFDYLTKPVNPDETLLTIKKALQAPEKHKPVTKTRQAGGTGKSSASAFVEGQSEESKELRRLIDLVAPTQLSVIIQGESGTGKEFVSRMIHQRSTRADKPFVAIDCGALSENLAGSELFGHVKGSFTGAMQDKQGQFQAATGGTLFLDEIGNLSYEVQVKLLRAIQEGVVRKIGSNKDEPVDVRIIAATNEDLTNASRGGDFREDLYHRLNEFMIKVLPLRQRKDDIRQFAYHFLRSSNQELNRNAQDFGEEVMNKFMDYPWPGNLRELKNVVRRAVLLTSGETVGLETLPSEIVAPPAAALPEEPAGGAVARQAPPPQTGSETDLKEMIERNERETIVRTLEQVKYNKSKAARLLNIDRKTLYNKLKLYNIDA